MHAHNQWHESCEVYANSSEFKSSKYFYLAGKSGPKSASYFHKWLCLKLLFLGQKEKCFFNPISTIYCSLMDTLLKPIKKSNKKKYNI